MPFSFVMNTQRRSPSRCLAISIFGSLLLFAGCRGRKHAAPRPSAPIAKSTATKGHLPPLPVGYTEQGTASWYGVPYHGRPAADGEIYNMETLVAAHRTMPFNTWLRVTNLSNSKAVTVRIIDRGPFVGNRIIDLSKAAARQIDLLGPGVGPVKLEVISAPADIVSNDFYSVQVGAFSIYENADRVRADFANRYGTAQLALKQGSAPLYRVLVGKVASSSAAQALADRLHAELNAAVFIVRLDQTVPPLAGPVAPAPPAADAQPDRN